MLELCFKGPKGSKISCFHFLSFHLCVSDMLYRKHYREELWYFLCFQEDKRQKNVSAGETEVASVDLKSEVGTLRRIDAGLLTSKHFFIAVLIVLISAAAYYFQKQNYPFWCRGWSFSLPDWTKFCLSFLGTCMQRLNVQFWGWYMTSWKILFFEQNERKTGLFVVQVSS